MRRTLRYTLFLLTLTAAVTYADCHHDGKSYKTGERVGPFVCMPDGTWSRRP